MVNFSTTTTASSKQAHRGSITCVCHEDQDSGKAKVTKCCKLKLVSPPTPPITPPGSPTTPTTPTDTYFQASSTSSLPSNKVTVDKKATTPMPSKPNPWGLKGITLTVLYYAVLPIYGIFKLMFYIKGWQNWRTKERKLPPITDPLLLESATSLSQRIRRGQVKSKSVVEAYIKRIKEVNPFINAVVADRFDDALIEASAADDMIEKELSRLRSQGTTEPLAFPDQPLLGIPITVKESMAVTGMEFTAGVMKRKGIIAQEDAPAVANLRRAGAIVLAKTNVPEILMSWECSNKIYGTTHNPYDLSRTAGGSSGGEAAIIAAGASLCGLGTDIGGSNRFPSHFCGVYGTRPSPFLTSTEGHYPVVDPPRKCMTSFGPICRYATDLPLFLKACMDPEKLESLNINLHMSSKELSGIKVYYQLEEYKPGMGYPVDPEIKQGIKDVATYLQHKFGCPTQEVKIPNLHYTMLTWAYKVKSKCSPSVGQLLANMDGSESVWWEMIKCVFWKSHHSFATLWCACWETLRPNFLLLNYFKKVREELRAEFEEFLTNDAIFLYPVYPTIAPKHFTTPWMSFDMGYCGVWNALELPSIGCPIGVKKEAPHMPYGLQVIGAKHNERLLCAVAKEIERAFGGWVPPCDIKISSSSS